MKLLVDMNLSPEWVDYLRRNAIDARHWSDAGDSKEIDAVIMEYARDNGFVVFTHADHLARGALITISPDCRRVRILPIRPEAEPGA